MRRRRPRGIPEDGEHEGASYNELGGYNFGGPAEVLSEARNFRARHPPRRRQFRQQGHLQSTATADPHPRKISSRTSRRPFRPSQASTRTSGGCHQSTTPSLDCVPRSPPRLAVVAQMKRHRDGRRPPKAPALRPLQGRCAVAVRSSERLCGVWHGGRWSKDSPGGSRTPPPTLPIGR